ncbi:glutathione S-transferase C-terminal domain-containing protein [uncultured Albimonas sp.]|uniref:glutathione S-transferase C-terminal domain-containing protein n=1 Tax=uncultured Albimonas sp. TaxID=1331701 RepID=UPI0030ED6544
MTDSPTPVRLVTCSTAPNPRRVNAFLVEKGVEIPKVEIELATRAHFEPEHLAKFGTHHLPALELSDGSTLTETMAICRLLEGLYPEPNLMGATPIELARIEQWNRRVEFMIMLPAAYVFRHSHPAMAALEVQEPVMSEWHRRPLAKGLEVVEARLAESPFLAGDRFTMADINAFIALDFMRVAKTRVPEAHTATLRWQAALKDRPSLQRYVPPAA